MPGWLRLILANRLLEVKDLEVHYGDIQALWGVSLHVDEGDIVSLVGANGAGKTTLLKGISGLQRPTKGSILFSGSSIVGLDPATTVNMGISLVPEGRRLFAPMTVLENLQLGAYPRRSRLLLEESLERVYDLFPLLKNRRKQIAGSLSGGEQQMLAIGRAVMTRPKILMLDEPSLGLSPLIVKAMFELIRTLRDQKVTILLVEQNVYHALKVSNYTYVMKTGRITMQGTGEELLANPEFQTAYLGSLD
jgi:branched-chain amino acid transport system ATP-binding protein